MHVGCCWHSVMNDIIFLLICRGYKVGSKDERYKDVVKLFKGIFCVTVLALVIIIVVSLVVFGGTVFIVEYNILSN